MNYLPEGTQRFDPFKKASVLSHLFFLYTLPLFKKGAKSNLDEADLYSLPSTLTSKNLGDKFEKFWIRQRRNEKNASILSLLLKNYGYYYFFLGLSQLIIQTSFIHLGSTVIGRFVSFFESGETNISKSSASLYGFSLIVLLTLNSLYIQWYEFKLLSLEIQIRVALSSLIYRKSLKLSSVYVDHMSVGKIVTLITKDVYNLEIFIGQANLIWIRTCQTIILIYGIYSRIGVVATIPLGFFALLTPLQIYIGVKAASMKQEMLAETDKRFQTTKSALLGIRIIKMHVWEDFFIAKLKELRKKEIALTSKIFFLKFVTNAICDLWLCVTFLLWLIIIKALGNKLAAEEIFFIFGNYKSMSFSVIRDISSAICHAAQAFATIKRVDQFLAAEEKTIVRKKQNKAQIHLNNVSITNRNKTILKNINLKFYRGLFLITGCVGSGKTSLLKAILGEYRASVGNLEVGGSMSYASQEPWIFPATIRQNILFGEKFNRERYHQVLKICDLVYDFERFKNGDQTLVESHGYNLSKGQRVRINLARAVYKDRDIYLLDDSLAALDVLVSSYIFQECVQKFLEDKLVLLVTNNENFIEKSENVIVLKDGLLDYSKNKESQESADIFDSSSYVSNECIERDRKLRPEITEENIYTEFRKRGPVGFEVYKQWALAGGGIICFVFLTCLVGASRLINRYLEKLISSWTAYEAILTTYSNNSEAGKIERVLSDQENVILLFGPLSVIVLIMTVIYLLFFLYFVKNCSIRLHKNLIRALFNAKISFFENNYIGNMLNRLSKDLINIDEGIPVLLLDFYIVLFLVIGVLILLVSVRNILLIPSLILLAMLYYYCKYYLHTARSLKRLEATTKSPVVGYFNATLTGITTIRADTNMTAKLQDEYDSHQNLYTSASFTSLCNKIAFTLMVRFICICFAGSVIFQFLIKKSDAGAVGFASFQTQFLVLLMSSLFFMCSELENLMTSVERVLEYTKIKQEDHPSFAIEKWQCVGEIVFENVSVAHPNLKSFILNKLNFVIHPNEKIGIVGRTGAGKSSLISAVFKLHDVKGRICVNGVDIETLPVKYLRSHISIVTQDPVIFKSTIRENIDPLKTHTDDEIWNALDAVGLKGVVSNLDVETSDEDGTFSVGQKQLLCLARAVIKTSRIVVVDEPTADVDQETEILICDIIERKFAECTLLMVTHRLEMLRRCDRIMILDKGQIVEFDRSSVLLQNKEGLFYKMVQASEIKQYSNL